MSKKYGTLISDMLEVIGDSSGLFEWPPPLTAAGAWKRWRNKKALRNSLYALKRRGLVAQSEKNGKIFLKLTAKGELEKLLSLAAIDRPKNWDKQWRLIIFDIPENAREKRNQLRWLLKRNGFVKLQASVFVSPYPLNREAIAYLKKSRLDNYIRIIRANEIDDDTSLKKHYGLA